MPMLVALAGKSRSGKGTAASVIKRKAAENGYSVAERQLSGPGKQYVADAFRPGITEAGAIEWFEHLKGLDTWVEMSALKSPGVEDRRVEGDVSLQEYLQRMLQGARERWGGDFWTDKLLPTETAEGEDDAYRIPMWSVNFLVGVEPHRVYTDLALISDLRQDNEADRVHLLSGVVFECIRPDHDDSYVTSAEHITERGLSPDKVDFTMHSIGNLDYWIRIWETAFDDHILPRLEQS